jgi:hypothetical protein
VEVPARRKEGTIFELTKLRHLYITWPKKRTMIVGIAPGNQFVAAGITTSFVNNRTSQVGSTNMSKLENTIHNALFLPYLF